jgi:aryl-alcohol dehydrogenase-like predicted oxidoreductase
MTMDHVRLGNSGLKVSPVCLGMMSYGDKARRTWFLSEDEAEPIVRRAVELGVTFFDTADMYSAGETEVITGRLLSRLFAHRDDYVLATKVYFPTGPGPNDRGLSRKHVMAAIDGSLRRLGTDYVDLYQTHRWDDGTPIEETLSVLDDLVRAGKVRYLGVSTMPAWQLSKVQYTAQLGGFTKFVSMQNHYNLLYREEEREMIPLCLDQGMGVIPWSPLARGMLTGTRSRDGARATARAADDAFADELYSDQDFDVVDAVVEVAARRGVPPAQVALAWLLAKPAVTAPVVGATRIGHVEDAVAATGLTLSAEEIARLEAPYVPHEVLPKR